VLRIFGPKREEDESWRKLHNDELHNLYSSSKIVRVIKSRRMRWAGYVTRMGEGRGAYRILVGFDDVIEFLIIFNSNTTIDTGVRKRQTCPETLLRNCLLI
jgi:hypothetical protein